MTLSTSQSSSDVDGRKIATHSAASCNLCVIAPGFGVASETWMYRQVVGMKHFEPSVITWRRENESAYPADGVEIDIVPQRSQGGRWARQCRRAMNRLSGRGSFDGDLRESRWLIKQIRGNSTDAILAHYGTTGVRLLPLAQSSGIPIFVHFNGFDLSRMVTANWYRQRLIQSMNRFAGLVVVASYMQNWLLENGADPERVHLIPYGAPMHELCVAEEQGADPCRFIMVGRLTEKKRPDLTLKAFASCIDKGCDATLTIIGDGDLRPACEQIIREAGISDQVHWLGVQPNERVREELARSSVFVQHSVTASDGDKEGWPVAIAEAAGTGLAVVSTRHAGIVDQVEEGRTGYLVDEGDWQAMADGMLALANAPADRIRMGQAARQKMMDCTTEQQNAKLEDVLLASAKI